MLATRTKIVILVFLILVVLVILFPSRKTNIDSPKNSDKNGQAPVQIVDIALVQTQHDQLFEQLRKFADTHAFAIRIAQVDPSGENFLVQMWREDVKIIGLDSGDPGLFEIAFYNTYEEQPVPSRVFDELIVELKEFIGQIPNTTFTVKE